MSVSQKINSFMTQSSWIRKMFEDSIKLKKQYGDENVFDFSLGNPNLDPPEQFRKYLIKTVGDDSHGIHGYMPNAGFYDTRTAIADYLNKIHNITSMSSDQIIMTCGAGGALNVVLKALLDPGDEVVIPAPFFVEYTFYIDNCGGIAMPVPTSGDFSLDLEAIAHAIKSNTKVILINSPNNPTGKVYDQESLLTLASLLYKKSLEFGHEIYLLSDEPYREIVYDKVDVPSVFQIYHNSIIVTSYSKTLSIPGERLGYIALNPEMNDLEKTVNAMILCNRILGFVNAPALMQRVITHMQGACVNVREYKRKRDLLCDGLAKIGYEFENPQGAFYLFPKTPIGDDVEFVLALQRENILTVPGSGFGRAGHIRICYCVDDKTITRAMNGFKKVFDACKKDK